MFPSIVEREEMFVLNDIVYLIQFTGAAVLGVANDHTRAVLHLHGALAAPVALDGHELTLPHHGLGLGDAVAGVLEDAPVLLSKVPYKLFSIPYRLCGIARNTKNLCLPTYNIMWRKKSTYLKYFY